MGASARAPVEVSFRETGLSSVLGKLRLLSNEGEVSGRKAGVAARQLASGVEQIARSGTIAGGGLKQVIAAASEMAFMFGAGGPLIGALGIAGVAVFSFFDGTRKQLEETRKKFEDEIAAMVNAGDNAQLLKKAQDLWVGTPAKLFKDGLKVLEQQEAEILGRLNSTAGITHAAIKKQLDEFRENTAIEEKRREFEELQRVILDVSNTPFRIQGIAPFKSEAIGEGGAGAGLVPLIENQFIRQLELFRDAIIPKAKLIGEDVGVAVQEGIFGVISVKGPPVPEITAAEAALKQRFEAMFSGITSALQSGFSSLIESVFGGGNVLAGLGSVLKQMGEVLITFSGIMETLAAALTNPFTAGPAAFAAGAALIALGSALGAAARGGGSRGGGASYTASLPPIVNTSSISMGVQASGVASRVMPATPVSVYQTIIGTNDPKAQRDILGMVNDAVRRGGRFA